MLSLILHNAADLLREEHIEVTVSDRIYAAVIDMALIIWLGYLISLVVGWMLS